MKKSFTDEEAMLPENVEFRRIGNEMAETALHNMIVQAKYEAGDDDIGLIMFATANIVGAVASRFRELGGSQRDVDDFCDMLVAASAGRSVQ
jgi:hypothetical protein